MLSSRLKIKFIGDDFKHFFLHFYSILAVLFTTQIVRCQQTDCQIPPDRAYRFFYLIFLSKICLTICKSPQFFYFLVRQLLQNLWETRDFGHNSAVSFVTAFGGLSY